MNSQASALNTEPVPAPPALNCSAGTRSTASACLDYACQWALLLFLSVAAYLMLSRFVLQMVQVQGQSMLPTLHNADRYVLNRWIYHFRQPHRGDVVVLKDPSDGDYAVKRIIAGCGDSVYISHGRLYLNGRELKEPYLAPYMPTYTCSKLREELVLCGRDQYFVMGDNRVNSFDSRMYGPVPRRNILGEIIH